MSPNGVLLFENVQKFDENALEQICRGVK